MDEWAPFVMGYQSHETIDGHNSIWALKGDVGVLSRTAHFRVSITGLVEAARVEFTLTGIDVPMNGRGLFTMEDDGTPTEKELGATGGADRLFRLVFTLELEPFGMGSPVVGALLEPLLRPFAAQLADQTRESIERRSLENARTAVAIAPRPSGGMPTQAEPAPTRRSDA